MRSEVATLALVTGLLVVPVSPASAAVTCRGLPATVVGSPSKAVLVGTDGPDVVVSAGSPEVDAGAGDDTVCLTGGVAGPDGYYVTAGDGDDDVEVVDTDPDGSLLDLGTGDDTAVGGTSADWVLLDRDASTGADSATTRGGADRVDVRGDDGAQSVMHLDLGSGNDVFVVGRVGFAPGSTFTGGEGRDQLEAFRFSQEASIRFDVPARQLLRNGTVVASGWVSFERFLLDHGYPRDDRLAQLAFVGSDEDEELVALGVRQLSADLGGGDDVVLLDRAGEIGGALDGGTGRDRVATVADDPGHVAVVDLAAGELTTTQGDAESLSLSGIEDADIDSEQTPGVLVGDGRANTLRLTCGRVEGGGGNDVIRQSAIGVRYDEPQRPTSCPGTSAFRADGDAGNDRILGSLEGDRLVGGAGRDTIDGLAGTDTCRSAEVRTSCEKR